MYTKVFQISGWWFSIPTARRSSGDISLRLLQLENECVSSFCQELSGFRNSTWANLDTLSNCTHDAVQSVVDVTTERGSNFRKLQFCKASILDSRICSGCSLTDVLRSLRRRYQRLLARQANDIWPSGTQLDITKWALRALPTVRFMMQPTVANALRVHLVLPSRVRLACSLYVL